MISELAVEHGELVREQESEQGDPDAELEALQLDVWADHVTQRQNGSAWSMKRDRKSLLA
jgi:hypothetical protein